MVKYILTFCAGAVVGNALKNVQVDEIKPATFKMGDKGKDIAAFQETLNKILGVNFIREIGTYDNETKKVVDDLFEGTDALIDEETGAIKKEFVLDFIKIFKKL